MGEGTNEQWIVTSTGPYIITWNFAAIKKGLKHTYTVTACKVRLFAFSI